MTPREKQIVVALTIVVAVTRLIAVAHSMWDWDEPLFCTALHDFNVADHHPHPPGFPLYIALGRAVLLFTGDDFRALQAIQVVSSMVLFPAMFALGRAMRFPFAVALSAALIFVFLPNVWFYGGTAFSDTFNIVLLLAALALLFDRQHYIGGTILFALSLLVRPQNILSAWPWLAASRGRRPHEIAASAAIVIGVVAAGYGAAAKATGFRTYVDAVRGHGHYIASVDGYGNPRRPPVLSLFPEFAIDPFGGGKASVALFAFAAIAVITPRRRDLETLATFVPFLVFAMFFLNTTGTGRLSIGYMPMHALLAADGMKRSADVLSARPLVRTWTSALLCAAIVLRFVWWIAPSLWLVHTTDSPPIAAMTWVRRHVPPRSTLFVHAGYRPFAEYALAGYDVHLTLGEGGVAHGWYVGSGTTSAPDAVTFVRPRDPLWAVFTERYFEAYVRRIP